jgi:hypothetical protein
LLWPPDVCFGSLADISLRNRHARFNLKSEHSSLRLNCPQGPIAVIGNYSITSWASLDEAAAAFTIGIVEEIV